MAEHEFVVPPAEFGAGSPVLAGMLIVFFVGCVWAVLAVRSFVEFRGRNSSLVGVNVTPGIFLVDRGISRLDISRCYVYDYVMFMIMIMICDGDYVLMILTILESHECDSFPVSAVFAVLRENVSGVLLGEISVCDTRYRRVSDIYCLDIIFVCFYQYLRFQQFLEIFGQCRRFLHLPGFSCFLKN